MFKILEKDVKVNIRGLDKMAQIMVSVEEEIPDLEGIDESTIAQFKNDEIACLNIRVEAVFIGLVGFEGVDSLSQCFVKIIRSYNEWGNYYADIRESREYIMEIVEEYGMIHNAILDLIENVEAGERQLKEFLNG